MSWFFGKKKSGGDALSTTVLPKTFEEAEGFTFVESTSNPYPSLEPRSGDGSSLPYGVTTSRQEITTNKPPLLPTDSLPHNPLQDIPFKLNSQLDIDVTELEVFLFNVNAVLTKAVQVNENIIKYNFSTERSVINEEQCANNDYS